MIFIQNKAILIADAHENEERRGFWEFLQALKNGEISTPQLILMGDIFDLLIGEISATHDFAKPYIDLLEELTKKIEIIYLEGNHDFNLKNLFRNVKVFDINSQPLECFFTKDENQKIQLAHGDIFLKPFLQFILKTLRNHYLLIFLNFLNNITFHAISKQILKNQTNKNLFYKIDNFDNLVQKRYEKYQANGHWVIEGHYHQNFIFNTEKINYINLPSFAYERSFFVVECQDKVKFQEQKLRC
ncbi:metallophosphoesterase [Campylobacter sp. CCS1377]|uniref:Metallophosphoesterase n=1 Tax=Campylobacter sp. CCS1377 TaxID=3158229 RepID=A0AAU7E942_9BACT